MQEVSPEDRLRSYFSVIEKLLALAGKDRSDLNPRAKLERDLYDGFEQVDPLSVREFDPRRLSKIIARRPLRVSSIFEMMAGTSDVINQEISDNVWMQLKRASKFPDESRPAFAALLYFARAYSDAMLKPLSFDPFALRDSLNIAVPILFLLLQDRFALHSLFNERNPLVALDRPLKDLHECPEVQLLAIATNTISSLAEKLNTDFEEHKERSKKKRPYAADDFVELVNDFSMEYRGRRISRNSENYNDPELIKMLLGLLGDSFGPGQIRKSMERVISKNLRNVTDLVSQAS